MAKPNHGPLRPEGHGDLRGGLRDERSQMVYDHHFSHYIIHITAISSFTPSSTACPVGVQFLPWMRGGSALLSSTTTYCGMLLRSREHRSSMAMHIPHTFHRSTSSVGLAGADGEFPVAHAATELMHDLRRKNTTTISPALWLLSFLS